MPVNEFGQPVGESLDWTARRAVEPVTLVGRTCRVEGLHKDHLPGLYDALVVRSPGSIWTYLGAGPFTEDAEGKVGFTSWLRTLGDDPDAVPHVLTAPDGTPQGLASYLRLDQRNGAVEVGNIALGAGLQRTTAATEAMYLMARHVFDDLGYRRYEWKCDSLNEPSRRAAERLGFTYEGRFRNAVVYKGRNRDTDWFSITDEEWPGVRDRLEEWLDPANFDAAGKQRRPLDRPGGPLDGSAPEWHRRGHG